MKIEKLTPGQEVFDCHKHRAGNTTMRTLGIWSVYIKEIDLVNRRVLASWNGNPAKWFYHREWSKWREKKPEVVKSAFGMVRLKTRAEKLAEKAAKKE